MQKLANGLIGSFTDENVNMNGIHSIENDFQHWRETLTGTIDEYIKSSNNVELNEQFGALSTNLNMSDFEYSANNLAEIQKQIDK